MKNARMTICLMAAVMFMATGQGFGTVYFNDGGTHNINYAINDDVYVDWQAPSIQTTVNLVSGGSIPNPYKLQGYNQSQINVSGGNIEQLNSYDYSTANISGGLFQYLYPRDNSIANVSDGSFYLLAPLGNSTTDISGGYVECLWTYYNSNTNISGGRMNRLHAEEHSTVTFYGKNFNVADGLILDGTHVLGLGTLSGEWLDGTPWTININIHDAGATIVAIPEPATLLLLGLGAVIAARRR